MEKYNKYERHRIEKKKEQQKKSTKKRFIYKLIALMVLLSIIASVGVFVFMEERESEEDPKLAKDPQPAQMNFLILGSDASAKGRTRTDVIMVASLNLESGKLGLFSLPRDTKVEIPGKDEDHKLNAAYAYGGPELVVKTVEKLLKVPIDYYVNTDFDGFREIVDTLGGVEVNVEKRLKYIDQAGGLYIDIPAGRQTLFGQEALEYIRFRHDKLGDIGRINRQHKFLKALLKKIYNPKVLLDAPELLRHIKDNVETDLPWLDSLKVVTKVVKVLKDLDQNKVEMVTLPGKAAYIDGISYWIPNQMLMNRVVDSLINSKEYIDNSKLDILVLNGNGKQGAAHQIEDLLSSSGYNVVQVRNADNFNYVQTWIYFKSKASKEAQELAKYLKGTPVKWDDVDDKQDSDIQKEADIKIILGENFNYS